MSRPIVSSSSSTPRFGACWPGRGLAVGAPFKPLHPYQAYRRAGAREQRFSEHMSHPTKAVDGNHDIFPSLCRQGGFGGEGKGRGGKARGDGRKYPCRGRTVRYKTGPPPLLFIRSRCSRFRTSNIATDTYCPPGLSAQPGWATPPVRGGEIQPGIYMGLANRRTTHIAAINLW